MSKNKKFYSKLLLFGEHTVNIGSQALAMPFSQFSGEWSYSEDTTKQKNLKDFATYLSDFQAKNPNIFQIDTDFLKNELEKGLYFDSTLPLGYGVGSSGALCAAIYDKFGLKKIKKTNLNDLKNALAAMESFFHGKSSGLDPLIAYTEKAILIENKNSLKFINTPQFSHNQEVTLFLIDTKISRQTEQYVHYFLKECENSSFKEKCTNELVVYNINAIQSLLNENWSNFYDNTEKISHFQLNNMEYFIPNQFMEIWEKGLKNELFNLKICGAGGGGFLLGFTFTKNFEQTKHILNSFNLIKI